MSDHLDNGGVGQSEVLSDGENINVLIRVRPRLPGDEEASSMTPGVSIQPNTITVNCKPQQKSFSFDWVAGPETSQSDIFNGVGKSITDRCLDGYNGTIFAYGQTGSGKTYTMLGAAVHEDYSNWDERGLIPRVLEYLFERISEKEKMNQRFLVKCSYLEIYNDRMTDLLNPGACEISKLHESFQ